MSPSLFFNGASIHRAHTIRTLNGPSDQYADGSSPRFTDTVPPSESRSRRWKSHSTPSTSAHSAERQPSRDTLWESGTASHARRPSLEEHTPSRTLRRPFEHTRRWPIISPPATMTDMNINRTPAAAAMRSTLRRLREIAEV